jgi:TRAP-type C4-dicarboxylate transport system substrate-binding protein
MLEAGFIYLMSNEPVRKPADLKNHKVWVPEGDSISRAVFEKAGVHPIPLPLPDVLTGLQTNLIDTVSCSPVAAIVLQWFTKVSYLSETPLLYNYGTLAISNNAWHRVPKQYQPMVLEILKREMSKVNQETRKDNQAALETLRKQGIQFVPITGENLADLNRIADEALISLKDKGIFDYQLLEKVRKAVAGLK